MFSKSGQSSLEAEQLHFEVQGRIGWDHAANCLLAVSVVRWAYQFRNLSDAHLSDTLIPSPDNFTLPKSELKWFVSVPGWVEFLSIEQSTHVVHRYFLALLWLLPVSWLDRDHFQWHFQDILNLKISNHALILTFILIWFFFYLLNSQKICDFIHYNDHWFIRNWWAQLQSAEWHWVGSNYRLLLCHRHTQEGK